MDYGKKFYGSRTWCDSYSVEWLFGSKFAGKMESSQIDRKGAVVLRFLDKCLLRAGVTVALASLLLSYGATTQAAAGDGQKRTAAQRPVSQALPAAQDTTHMGAWQDFWQKLLNGHAVPDDYTKTVKIGGLIEQAYLFDGPHRIARQSMAAPKPMEQYEIYYPADLAETAARYPAVIVVNGSGTPAKRYPALFQHLASWGFIVIGNEDPSTGTGQSADRTASKLLELNEAPDSQFYHRIDIAHIGITGHSQGGAGVFNAITSQPHHALYRTAVALSPTNERVAEALHWTYDPKAVAIPIFLLAGAQGDFELKIVLPKEDMQSMYAKIPAPKAMARCKGAEHGQMLYTADGYVTAWFCWHLQGDSTAAKVFSGNSPELLQNRCYQDVKLDGFD